MQYRKFILSTIWLPVLLMACQFPFLSRRSKPAANMRITDSREVSITDATIMDRSPDGRWLIVYTYADPRESQLCIYASDDLKTGFCIPERDEIGVTLQPIAWSPDSKKLVLV